MLSKRLGSLIFTHMHGGAQSHHICDEVRICNALVVVVGVVVVVVALTSPRAMPHRRRNTDRMIETILKSVKPALKTS